MAGARIGEQLRNGGGGDGEGKDAQAAAAAVEAAMAKGVDPSAPVYTMQALWGGKMTIDEFEVNDKEVPSLAHDAFEQDEALPVIDVSALLPGGDVSARAATIDAMVDAAKTWGFFQIRNHGVPLEVVKRVERDVKKFFALPMEKKLMVQPDNFSFGYIAGSPISWRHKWWLERLHMRAHEEKIRGVVDLVWPDDEAFAAEFIGDVVRYLGVMRELARVVVEALTEGLGLPRSTFTSLETADANCNAQVNHYPACPDPAKVLGIPAHTDPQMLSILFQDEVGGLQFRKGDGSWVGVRPHDSLFVVNLGDTFQALSNGILHSPVHRVAVNSTRPRYTTIYFYGVDNVVALSAPPQLVTDARPLKYRPFSVNEYRAHLVREQVPLNASKFLEI